MTTTAQLTAPESLPHRGAARFWDRTWQHFPSEPARKRNLALILVTTIVLYYCFSVQGSVAPQILQRYDLGFTFFVYMGVLGGMISAFFALLTGLADRVGRANIIVVGLFLVAAITTFLVPHAGSTGSFFFWTIACQAVEGVVLVITPTLARDFSPQVGRATAMSLWTLGPIGGALIASEVGTHTLTRLGRWQDLYVIAGIACFVVAALAAFLLRELSPRLRDQVMVSLQDTALLEARARGLDLESEELRHPWRTALSRRVFLANLGLPVFLVIFVVSTFFFTIFFTTVFGFTSAQANGLNTWLQGAQVVTLVVAGPISDRLLVRKPFVVVGGVGTIVMTFVLQHIANQGHVSYDGMKWTLLLLGIFIGIVEGTWLAAYTETVEARNPAATAEGLAVQGWSTRLVSSAALFLLPILITSVTVLANEGPKVQALATRNAALVTLAQQHPALFAELSRTPAGKLPPADVLNRAIEEIGVPNLQKIAKVQPELTYLSIHGPKVAKAQAESGGQWGDYLWVAIGGQFLLLGLTFLLGGPWSPRRARREQREHERAVAAALADAT